MDTCEPFQDKLLLGGKTPHVFFLVLVAGWCVSQCGTSAVIKMCPHWCVQWEGLQSLGTWALGCVAKGRSCWVSWDTVGLGFLFLAPLTQSRFSSACSYPFRRCLVRDGVRCSAIWGSHWICCASLFENCGCAVFTLVAWNVKSSRFKGAVPWVAAAGCAHASKRARGLWLKNGHDFSFWRFSWILFKISFTCSKEHTA